VAEPVTPAPSATSENGIMRKIALMGRFGGVAQQVLGLLRPVMAIYAAIREWAKAWSLRVEPDPCAASSRQGALPVPEGGSTGQACQQALKVVKEAFLLHKKPRSEIRSRALCVDKCFRSIYSKELPHALHTTNRLARIDPPKSAS